MKYKNFIEEFNIQLNRPILTENIFTNIQLAYRSIKEKIINLKKYLKNVFNEQDMKIIENYYTHELKPIVLKESAEIVEQKSKTEQKEIDSACENLKKEQIFLETFLQFLTNYTNKVKTAEGSYKHVKFQALTTLLHYLNNQLSSLKTLIYIFEKGDKVENHINDYVLNSKIAKKFDNMLKVVLNINYFERSRLDSEDDEKLDNNIVIDDTNMYWRRITNKLKRSSEIYNNNFKEFLLKSIKNNFPSEYQTSEKMSEIEALIKKTVFITFITEYDGVQIKDIKSNNIDEIVKKIIFPYIKENEKADEIYNKIIEQIIHEYNNIIKNIINEIIPNCTSITEWFKDFISRGGLINRYQIILQKYISSIKRAKMNKLIKIDLDQDQKIGRVEMYNKFISNYLTVKETIENELIELFKEQEDIKIPILDKSNISKNAISTLALQSQSYDTLMQLSYYVINLFEAPVKEIQKRSKDSTQEIKTSKEDVRDNILHFAKTLTKSISEYKANKILNQYLDQLAGENIDIRIIFIIHLFLEDVELQKKLFKEIEKGDIDVTHQYNFIFSTSYRSHDPEELKKPEEQGALRHKIQPIPIKMAQSYENKIKKTNINEFVNQIIHFYDSHKQFFEDVKDKYNTFIKEYKQAIANAEQHVSHKIQETPVAVETLTALDGEEESKSVFGSRRKRDEDED